MPVPDCCAHAAAGPPPLAFGLLLGTGLLMSVGHCVGMCGPLLSAYALAQKERTGSARGHFGALALYHAGRISGYVVIGLVLGLLGLVLGATGGARPVQGWLSLGAGLLMILLALGLFGWLPTQRWVERLWPGDVAARAARSLLHTRTAGGRYLLGMANGFLPCGPVAAVALSAISAGKPLAGALGMAAYGLGTVPALVVLGLGVGSLSPGVRARLSRLGALLVLLIGVQLALRGMHAAGWIGGLAIGPVVLW